MPDNSTNVFPPSHYQSLATLLWQMNKPDFERLCIIWSPLKTKSCSESQKAHSCISSYSLPRYATSPAFPWFLCARGKPPDELSIRLTGDQSAGNQKRAVPSEHLQQLSFCPGQWKTSSPKLGEVLISGAAPLFMQCRLCRYRIHPQFQSTYSSDTQGWSSDQVFSHLL